MSSIVPRRRVFHLAAGFVSTALFLAVVTLLPSLKTATNPQMVVKCAVEIIVALAILYALVRCGEPPRALGLRPVRAATFGWGLLCFLAIAVLSIVTLFSRRSAANSSTSFKPRRRRAKSSWSVWPARALR